MKNNVQFTNGNIYISIDAHKNLCEKKNILIVFSVCLRYGGGRCCACKMEQKIVRENWHEFLRQSHQQPKQQ